MYLIPSRRKLIEYSSISTTELRAPVNVKNSKLVHIQSVTNTHSVHRNTGGIDCPHNPWGKALEGTRIHLKLLRKFYRKFSNIFANFFQNKKIFYCPPLPPHGRKSGYGPVYEHSIYYCMSKLSFERKYYIDYTVDIIPVLVYIIFDTVKI